MSCATDMDDKKYMEEESWKAKGTRGSGDVRIDEYDSRIANR
jgi:hypothetical protein